MTFKAEVKGKAAERFRAYQRVKLLRKPTIEDHGKRAAAKLPALSRGDRIRYDGEDVAAEGPVVGEAVTIAVAPEITITRVVFYAGPVESEVVVGSVEVNAPGPEIEVQLVEPSVPEGGKPIVVDE